MKIINKTLIISLKKKYVFKLISIFFFLFYFHTKQNKSYKYNYPQDYITIVTTLYQIPTNRHKFEEYLVWIENLLSLNKSIVFYIQKNLSHVVKSKRPKIYENKTIWIENEFSDLYFYKFKKEFEDTYEIDKLKYKHNVPLFIIWNEKMKFLENAIKENYFGSKYFLWIDAGYFKEKNMSKYVNNWPSIKKCNQEPRVIMNEIRKLGKDEFYKLMAFDNETHRNFQNDFNIAGNAFGGRIDFFSKFIKYYYETFRLFMNKGQFIGSDQNLYCIISYLHPKIAKRIYSGDYQYLKNYYF